MNEAEQKKIMLLSKKEKLLRELSEVDKDIEEVLEETWKEEAIEIYNNVDALLEFCKTHTGRGCSDEKKDTDSCLRCMLLNVQELDNDEEWDHKKFGIEVKLVDRKNSIAVTKSKAENPTKKLAESKIPKPSRAPRVKSTGTEPMIKGKRILEIDEAAADLD